MLFYDLPDLLQFIVAMLALPVLVKSIFQLLPACNAWEDCLWAYFKVLVDVRVEQVILLNFLCKCLC